MSSDMEMEALPILLPSPGQWLIVWLGRKPGEFDGLFFIAPRGHMKVIQPQHWLIILGKLPQGFYQSIHKRADSTSFHLHPELTYLPKP